MQYHICESFQMDILPSSWLAGTSSTTTGVVQPVALKRRVGAYPPLTVSSKYGRGKKYSNLSDGCSPPATSSTFERERRQACRPALTHHTQTNVTTAATWLPADHKRKEVRPKGAQRNNSEMKMKSATPAHSNSHSCEPLGGSDNAGATGKQDRQNKDTPTNLRATREPPASVKRGWKGNNRTGALPFTRQGRSATPTAEGAFKIRKIDMKDESSGESGLRVSHETRFGVDEDDEKEEEERSRQQEEENFHEERKKLLIAAARAIGGAGATDGDSVASATVSATSAPVFSAAETAELISEGKRKRQEGRGGAERKKKMKERKIIKRHDVLLNKSATARRHSSTMNYGVIATDPGKKVGEEEETASTVRAKTKHKRIIPITINNCSGNTDNRLSSSSSSLLSSSSSSLFPAAPAAAVAGGVGKLITREERLKQNEDEEADATASAEEEFDLNIVETPPDNSHFSSKTIISNDSPTTSAVGCKASFSSSSVVPAGKKCDFTAADDNVCNNTCGSTNNCSTVGFTRSIISNSIGSNRDRIWGYSWGGKATDNEFKSGVSRKRSSLRTVAARSGSAISVVANNNNTNTNTTTTSTSDPLRLFLSHRATLPMSAAAKCFTREQAPYTEAVGPTAAAATAATAAAAISKDTITTRGGGEAAAGAAEQQGKRTGATAADSAGIAALEEQNAVFSKNAAAGGAGDEGTSRPVLIGSNRNNGSSLSPEERKQLQLQIPKTQELQAALVGQIARSLTVFGIDEIVVYEDVAAAVACSRRADHWSRALVFFVRQLEYLETPQYLRRSLFPLHPVCDDLDISDLRYAGLQNPLDAPHHLRRCEWLPYRDGVVVASAISASTFMSDNHPQHQFKEERTYNNNNNKNNKKEKQKQHQLYSATNTSTHTNTNTTTTTGSGSTDKMQRLQRYYHRSGDDKDYDDDDDDEEERKYTQSVKEHNNHKQEGANTEEKEEEEARKKEEDNDFKLLDISERRILREKGGSWVDCGLSCRVWIPQQLPPHSRVTIRFDTTARQHLKRLQQHQQQPHHHYHNTPIITNSTATTISNKNDKKKKQQHEGLSERYIKGTAVSRDEPPQEFGLYWGYYIRVSRHFSDIFTGCPFTPDGRYDVTIGTSERGSSISEKSFSLPPFRHLLIVFGALQGLEAVVSDRQAYDSNSSVTRQYMQEISSAVEALFSMYINTCDQQHSRTIRTEEALPITLSLLRPHILANNQAAAAVAAGAAVPAAGGVAGGPAKQQTSFAGGMKKERNNTKKRERGTSSSSFSYFSLSSSSSSSSSS